MQRSDIYENLNQLVSHHGARKNEPTQEWKRKLRLIMTNRDADDWYRKAILLKTLEPLMGYKTKKKIAPYIWEEDFGCSRALFLIRLMADPLREHRATRKMGKPRCPCKQSDETIFHFVMECPLMSESWKRTRRKGYSIWDIRELIYDDVRLSKF